MSKLIDAVSEEMNRDIPAGLTPTEIDGYIYDIDSEEPIHKDEDAEYFREYKNEWRGGWYHG